MNKTVEAFIDTHLHIEMAYVGMHERARKTIPTFGPDFESSLKAGFEELLVTRELSAGDYDGLTHVAFASDDDLYVYLQGIYDYLFNGADTAPAPPE